LFSLGLSFHYTQQIFSQALSSDQGKTWSHPLSLRDNGGGRDIGYVRSIVRPDGNVVAVYYYHDQQKSERYLAATTWNPGKP
jgi:hypothetical protein